MQNFLDQAKHNKIFHACIEDKFAGLFHDWKITVLFYVAIHYLKALAAFRKIDIGDTHIQIEANVNPDRNGAKMRITKNAWREYKNLYRYSQTARYNGITDIKTFEALKAIDHSYCLQHLENFKKYIIGQGVKIED